MAAFGHKLLLLTTAKYAKECIASNSILAPDVDLWEPQTILLVKFMEEPGGSGKESITGVRSLLRGRCLHMDD